MYHGEIDLTASSFHRLECEPLVSQASGPDAKTVPPAHRPPLLRPGRAREHLEIAVWLTGTTAAVLAASCREVAATTRERRWSLVGDLSACNLARASQ